MEGAQEAAARRFETLRHELDEKASRIAERLQMVIRQEEEREIRQAEALRRQVRRRGLPGRLCPAAMRNCR